MKKCYREPAGESFPQIEAEVSASWKALDILARVKERMQGGDPMVFCEGPPTANTPPHIGHAVTRAVKDAILRYHVMNGRMIVPYIAGWDCHGLPVELEVERSLDLGSKKEIEAYGIAKFNSACRERVMRYKADWEEMSRRVGYSIDYENAYLTMSNDYIESVWWSLKQLHSKSLLGKDRQVVPYCPRCGTALSTHEVALGFEETEVRWLVVRFRIDSLDASALVYTETPWTLVSNALLAVDKDRDYVITELGGERLLVAEEKLPLIAPSSRVVNRLRGEELLSKIYTPPFDYRGSHGEAFKVVHSPDVGKAEGTGIMHVSPAYGSADYEIGTAEGVEIFDPVDETGRFTGAVQELSGKLVTDATSDVVRSLESKGLLFKWGIVKRSSPFCWRCDSPLIYKLRDAWFVRASPARNRMLELNSGIAWVPSTFRDGRFGNFLEEAKDWVVSRSRYWGTPLPIWKCGNGHEVCVGSLEELAKLSETPLNDGFDLHRPFVDDISLRCPECAGQMKREPFVLDFWYDSGCAPFAQYHYPFDNVAEFDTHRSVDFISECEDQTRGWFYTQHVISTLLFDLPAFKSVLVMGNVLDSTGKRLDKGSGEVAPPSELFTTVGADAARLHLLGLPIWQSVQFSKENVRHTMVGPLTTLLNLYAFYSSNANAYGYTGQRAGDRTHDLDRWVLSRLNTTIMDVRAGFDTLEVHRAVRAINLFVEDLSNWYVRRSRRRFWLESDPEDRFSAHSTLHDCLMSLSIMMAPVSPFFSDWLYTCMKGPEASVHLETFPEAEGDAVNRKLEANMALVRRAVDAGRAARQDANVKLRQPLDEAIIAAGMDGVWILRRYERMIADELNVKKVECIESRNRMVEFTVAPNLRVLGPKLKESAVEVSRLLEKVDGNELARHLRSKGKVRLGGFDLREEDVIISERQKSGYAHASLDEIHVYISLTVDKRLKIEGLAREVIRRVQHMRKEMGLQFEDAIDVEFRGHNDIETAIASHQAHISHEIHARSVVKNENLEGGTKWTVNKMLLELAVRKV